MGGFKPVPLDALPIPQAAQPVQFQPANIDPLPSNQPPGAGSMGRTGKVADIASNFLQGWLKGKNQAEQTKLQKAEQNIQGAQYAFQIAQANAAKIADDPSATPEMKQQAEQARKQAWAAYLNVAQQYTEPEKKSGGKKGGVKGAMGNMAEGFKKTFGVEDPHVFSQMSLALLRQTGPPPLPEKSPQEKLADLDIKWKAKETQIVDQLGELYKQPSTPEVQKQIEILQRQLDDIQGQRGGIKTVTTGQPIRGEDIGRTPGTFWWPQVNYRGENVGYLQTGDPKETAARQSHDQKVQDVMTSRKVSKDEAEKIVAQEEDKIEKNKANPPPVVSISKTADSTGVTSEIEHITSKGGGVPKAPGEKPMTAPPKKDPMAAAFSHFGVSKIGQTAIRKEQDKYEAAEKAARDADRAMARIAQDPKNAAQEDFGLISDHLAMTARAAGMRPANVLWKEIVDAHPILQGANVNFGPDGKLLGGASLSPQQRSTIVIMIKDRLSIEKHALNEEKARYGLKKKLRSPEGHIGYVDTDKYESGKDSKYKDYEVLEVE